MEEAAAHGEPGHNRYLRAAVAAIVERIKSDRAAALQAAVDTGTIKGTSLEAALGDFRCERMGRAWRKPFPRDRRRLGRACPQAARPRRRSIGRKPAVPGALYAAASDYSERGTFAPAAWEPHTWKMLSGRLRTYR